MKFTALPVNVGDSFLLQVENKVILVDGGMNKSHIIKLLRNENIKDNHIDFAGGVSQAITKTKAYLAAKNLDIKIIVEARDLEEIQEILDCGGVYRILIDNFNLNAF